SHVPQPDWVAPLLSLLLLIILFFVLLILYRRARRRLRSYESEHDEAELEVLHDRFSSGSSFVQRRTNVISHTVEPEDEFESVQDIAQSQQQQQQSQQQQHRRKGSNSAPTMKTVVEVAEEEA